MEKNVIYNGDSLEVLKTLQSNSVDCCVTSPPYYALRNYGSNGQIGMEDTPEEYITKLVEVFSEVKRVLKDDGTLWLNIGDTYCGTGHKKDLQDPKNISGRNGQSVAINNKLQGYKPKDLIGIPWMLAFALRADGWYLRQDIIWRKPNCMPAPLRDRCVTSKEYIFLLSKSRRYYFDYEAIQEPAKYAGDNRGSRTDNRRDKDMNSVSGTTGEFRNKRDVWDICTQPYRGAHFAVFPRELASTCILAGCPTNGVVLDPFFGSGTVGIVAKSQGKHYIGIDLNRDYCDLASNRILEYR